MTTHPSIRHNISLRDYNSFGLDSTASHYLHVSSLAALQAITQDPALCALPRLVLGGGTNMLLTRDFPGLVVHVCSRGIEITGQDEQATYVRAAAGENWHALVQWTLAKGLGGLENLSLIPGSAGAAPVQNIGAYGMELKDCLHAVTAFDFATGQTITLNNAQCQFGYRDSIFKHALSDAVIIDITLALPRHWQPRLGYADVAQALAASGITAPSAQDISDAVIAIRRRKLPDPAVLGNAGSFFKNPVVPPAVRDALLQQHPQLVSYAQPDGTYKLAAGWLIDQCQWKGKNRGRAAVYEKQALVLVNLGGASGQEVVQLAEAIQADVEAHFGVRLEPEPIFV